VITIIVLLRSMILSFSALAPSEEFPHDQQMLLLDHQVASLWPRSNSLARLLLLSGRKLLLMIVCYRCGDCACYSRAVHASIPD
jgi:hypothetical protein